MALITCPDCGKSVSDAAPSCPHCGRPISAPAAAPSPLPVTLAPAKTSKAAWGCLFLIMIIVLMMSKSLITSGTGGSSASTLGSSPGGTPQSAEQPLPPPPPGSQWSYSHDSDEMTGKTTHSATVASENTVEFGFPYQGSQHARLTIRRHPRFGNDVVFSIEKGQLLCPSYDGCTVLVRFDEGEPVSFSAAGAADHSSETLFIQNYDRFLSKMRAAKAVRISPKVYQQGSVVFTFDVTGFDPKKFRPE
jgi:hypothetical protein